MPTFPPISVAGNGNLYARLHTSQGVIVVQLYEKEAPQTVANWVGLANGSVPWKDPLTGRDMQGTPLYGGVRFHRWIHGSGRRSPQPIYRSSSQGALGHGRPGLPLRRRVSPLTQA